MSIRIPIISDYDAKGVDRAIKDFQQLKTTGEKAQFALKKAAIPAAAAVGGLAVAIGDATKAAMEDQQEQAQLALTLQNVTGAGQKQTDQVEKQIAAMSKASGIADTEYRKSFEALVRGTKDVGLAMKDMNLVMDISTSLQMDSATVADALAKAYQGNFKALRSLSPEMASMIKDGASLNQIMDVLGGTFGGATAKNADTAAGKMKIFNNSINEAKESIGAAFVPVLEAALPKMTQFANWAQNNPQVFTRVALAIGSIAAATVAVNAALATNPFVLAAGGVLAMAIAYNKLVDAAERMNKLGGLAARFIGFMISPIAGLAGNIIRGIEDVGGMLSKKAPNNMPTGTLAVPAMANGGIVDSPTLALIGENGPEAVVPLNRGMGGGVNITINGGLGTSTDIANAVYENLRFYNQNIGPLRIRTS